MATIVQDLNNVSRVLRTQYLPFLNNALNTQPSPFLEKIKKPKVTANTWERGLRMGVAGGFGMSYEGGAIPSAMAPVYDKLTGTIKDMYTTVEVSHKAFQLARTSGAFVDTVLDNVKASHESAAWNVGRMLFGDGSGKLCQIIGAVGTSSAVTSDTITVDDTSKLIVGLGVDVYAASVSSNATAPTLAKVQIKAINHATKQVKLSAGLYFAQGTTATTPTGFLTVQGSFQREITGMSAIYDSTVTSIYGLTKANVPALIPYTKDAQHDLTDTLITDAVTFAKDNNNVEIDMILAGPAAYQNFENYMKTRNNHNVIVKDYKYVGGAVGYEIIAGNRKVVVVREKFVPSAKMWGVCTDDWELYQTGWNWMNEQGPVLTRKEGSSVYQGALANYGELICVNPGGCIEITNCDEA